MRPCWRTCAAIVILGCGPLVGCHQLPKGKSAQDLRPIEHKAGTAPQPQELTAADIFQNTLAQIESLQRENRVPEAIALCEKLREPGSPYAPHATWKIATLCENDLDHLDRAEDEYRALLEQYPGHPDVLAKVGDLYSRRGKFGIAEKVYGIALKSQPNHVSARNGLAFALAMNGYFDQSLTEYVKLFPETPQGRAEAYCSVAAAMEMQKKPADARRAYETALKLDPQSQRARQRLFALQQTTPGEESTSEIRKMINSRITRVIPIEGSVELEPAPMPIVLGTSQTAVSRPTLPPLPPLEMPVENHREWKSSVKR